jgi:hypothetical protein
MEKQDLINLYNSILDTNKSFMELAKANKRAWVRQEKVNKRLFLCLVACITYIVVNERAEKKQDTKIDNLMKEIKELKESKGE